MDTSLRAGQLIYTSIPTIGFKLLSSEKTPQYIQDALIEKIVNIRWDPYSPPGVSYRAAYCYQSESDIDYCIFGWLYHDGRDEYGRAGIPYFIAYYILESLTQEYIQLILKLMEKGPLDIVKRQKVSDIEVKSLILHKDHNYAPPRLGVKITQPYWEASTSILNDNHRINWFLEHIGN